MNIDEQNQLFLARLLGEVYRIQKHRGVPCAVSDGHIFGLLHGFEHVVEEELDTIGFVPKESFEYFVDILTAIENDASKLESFKGYYDIEKELEKVNISRDMALKILNYLNASKEYQQVIKKMDSTDSPMEFRSFKQHKEDL